MRGIRQGGFTLLEVILAVAILAVAMMGVFTIYTQSTVEIQRARHRTLALACAQQMLDMIASTPYHLLTYHGFSTTSSPPFDSPVYGDLSLWQSSVHALPTQATGMISVEHDLDILYTVRVTVSITYDNYGRSTTITLSMNVPQPQLS